MKIDYLPTEDDIMYAFYDDQKNEVRWWGCSKNTPYDPEYSQFVVTTWSLCKPAAGIRMISTSGWS
jgi:hypothetical protein